MEKKEKNSVSLEEFSQVLQKMERINDENLKLKDEIKKKNNIIENNKLKQEKEKLQNEILELKEKNKKLEMKLKTNVSEINNLKEINEEFRRAKEVINNKNNENIESVKYDNQQKEAEYIAKINKLNDEIIKEQAKYNDKKEEMEGFKIEKEEIYNRVELLVKEKLQKEEENKQLKAELKDAKGVFSIATKEKNEALEKKAKLEEQIQQLKKEKEKLKKQLDEKDIELKKQKEESNETIKNLEQQNDFLSELNKPLEGLISDYQREKDFMEQIEQLKTKNKDLEQSIIEKNKMLDNMFALQEKVEGKKEQDPQNEINSLFVQAKTFLMNADFTDQRIESLINDYCELESNLYYTVCSKKILEIYKKNTAFNFQIKYSQNEDDLKIKSLKKIINFFTQKQNNNNFKKEAFSIINAYNSSIGLLINLMKGNYDEIKTKGPIIEIGEERILFDDKIIDEIISFFPEYKDQFNFKKKDKDNENNSKNNNVSKKLQLSKNKQNNTNIIGINDSMIFNEEIVNDYNEKHGLNENNNKNVFKQSMIDFDSNNEDMLKNSINIINNEEEEVGRGQSYIDDNDNKINKIEEPKTEERKIDKQHINFLDIFKLLTRIGVCSKQDRQKEIQKLQNEASNSNTIINELLHVISKLEDTEKELVQMTSLKDEAVSERAAFEITIKQNEKFVNDMIGDNDRLISENEELKTKIKLLAEKHEEILKKNEELSEKAQIKDNENIDFEDKKFLSSANTYVPITEDNSDRVYYEDEKLYTIRKKKNKKNIEEKPPLINDKQESINIIGNNNKNFKAKNLTKENKDIFNIERTKRPENKIYNNDKIELKGSKKKSKENIITKTSKFNIEKASKPENKIYNNDKIELKGKEKQKVNVVDEAIQNDIIENKDESTAMEKVENVINSTNLKIDGERKIEQLNKQKQESINIIGNNKKELENEKLRVTNKTLKNNLDTEKLNNKTLTNENIKIKNNNFKFKNKIEEITYKNCKLEEDNLMLKKIINDSKKQTEKEINEFNKMSSAMNDIMNKYNTSTRYQSGINRNYFGNNNLLSGRQNLNTNHNVLSAKISKKINFKDKYPFNVLNNMKKERDEVFGRNIIKNDIINQKEVLLQMKRDNDEIKRIIEKNKINNYKNNINIVNKFNRNNEFNRNLLHIKTNNNNLANIKKTQKPIKVLNNNIVDNIFNVKPLIGTNANNNILNNMKYNGQNTYVGTGEAVHFVSNKNKDSNLFNKKSNKKQNNKKMLKKLEQGWKGIDVKKDNEKYGKRDERYGGFFNFSTTYGSSYNRNLNNHPNVGLTNGETFGIRK